MKKVLFALSLVAAFSFVACNGTSDCACTIKMSDGTTVKPGDDGVGESLYINDFDGDCKDANWSDLPSSSHDWASVADSGTTLSCEDK